MRNVKEVVYFQSHDRYVSLELDSKDNARNLNFWYGEDDDDTDIEDLNSTIAQGDNPVLTAFHNVLINHPELFVMQDMMQRANKIIDIYDALIMSDDLKIIHTREVKVKW